MGRELCLFALIYAGKVPLRQRAEFVALAVRRIAPFNDPDFDVLWLADHACVWYWSKARIPHVPATARGRVRHRAEALFLGGIREGDTCELLALETPNEAGQVVAHGFEARVWRGGRLVSTRWWPALPTDAEWQDYVRGSGLAPDTPRPVAAPAQLLASPLAPLRAGKSALGPQLAGRWRVIALGLAAPLALPLAWQTAGAARAAWERRQVEQRIDVITTRLQRIVDARAQADAASARITELLALRPPASQSRLLAEVATLTPKEWQVQSWSLPSPDTLEVTLKGASSDPSAIVSAWEASPLLEDVSPSSSSRNDELTLQAKITPLKERKP